MLEKHIQLSSFAVQRKKTLRTISETCNLHGNANEKNVDNLTLKNTKKY
jgi:hypothetical protein